MTLVWITGFSLLGSIGAITFAGAYCIFPARTRTSLIPYLISYATGTLLGAAFLGLLPHALERASAETILPTVLAGIVSFFLLEKVVIWRHCHNEKCEQHAVAGPLLLIGDALHNFIDGVAIAAAFTADTKVGMATALAVLAHELPQEVGDFAILIESGYSRKQAFTYNILSGISTLPGALLAYFFLLEMHGLTSYIMALSAASFIYIAIADLIPGLHQRVDLRQSISQVLLILSGIGTIILFHANL